MRKADHFKKGVGGVCVSVPHTTKPKPFTNFRSINKNDFMMKAPMPEARFSRFSLLPTKGAYCPSLRHLAITPCCFIPPRNEPVGRVASLMEHRCKKIN